MATVQYHYGKFPPAELDWKQLIPLIGPANAALARYDGTLNAVPNPNVLLSPLATQEAVLSSKIEGTVTTITEVLKFEAKGAAAEKSPEKVADIQEVLNYKLPPRNASCGGSTQKTTALPKDHQGSPSFFIRGCAR